jgi:hypothetical protein
MATRKATSKIKMNKIIAADPIVAPEMETAECILAHLIAVAYLADHPEFFRHTTATDGASLPEIVVPSRAFDDAFERTEHK